LTAAFRAITDILGFSRFVVDHQATPSQFGPSPADSHGGADAPAQSVESPTALPSLPAGADSPAMIGKSPTDSPGPI